VKELDGLHVSRLTARAWPTSGGLASLGARRGRNPRGASGARFDPRRLGSAREHAAGREKIFRYCTSLLPAPERLYRHVGPTEVRPHLAGTRTDFAERVAGRDGGGARLRLAPLAGLRGRGDRGRRGGRLAGGREGAVRVRPPSQPARARRVGGGQVGFVRFGWSRAGPTHPAAADLAPAPDSAPAVGVGGLRRVLPRWRNERETQPEIGLRGGVFD
jgi:hypothetical protein